MPSASRSKGKPSSAHQTIPGSPNEDGSAPRTSNQAIHWSRQPKPCEWCGAMFLKKRAGEHRKARFCSTSCSAKWRMSDPERVAALHTPEVRKKRGEARSTWLASGLPGAQAEIERVRAMSPMSDPAVRAKVSRRLKSMGHAPSVRGGNGRGMTRPQSMLMDALGEPWQAEFCVSLGRRTPGYPTHYKLDLANAERRVGIEVDGASHHSRKALDVKKDQKLASLGWTVLRFWNREILDWIDSGMPTEHSVSMTLASSAIRPSR